MLTELNTDFKNQTGKKEVRNNQRKLKSKLWQNLKQITVKLHIFGNEVITVAMVFSNRKPSSEKST